MRSLGPLWVFVLSLDRDLAVVLGVVNLLFALTFVWIVFRRRARTLGWVGVGLMVLGLFTVVTALSLISLHLFARTPVHEIGFFALD